MCTTARLRVLPLGGVSLRERVGLPLLRSLIGRPRAVLHIDIRPRTRSLSSAHAAFAMEEMNVLIAHVPAHTYTLARSRELTPARRCLRI